MNKIKYTALLLFFFLGCISGFAQPEYTAVKNQFLANAESQRKAFDNQDDLSFLMGPLTELELNRDYILSDFRRPFRFYLPPKDISSLRLYVRNVKQSRPDDSYFDKEYSRYLKCRKNKVAYKAIKNSVPFIWPFQKIKLTGTQMSVWQAYLLDRSESLFGMRNEANYNQEYILTSAQDVDSIISLIRDSWDSSYFSETLDSSKIEGESLKHFIEVKKVTESLRKIRGENLDPVFEYGSDSVTIAHYSFMEFRGLVRCRTTLILSHNHHYVREIRNKKYDVVAKYSRYVFY